MTYEKSLMLNAPATSRPAVQVEKLWKVFGPRTAQVLRSSELLKLDGAALFRKTGCTAAVRDVSFDVDPGEVFVVMGLSGSGKSTLIRCLIRLIEPSQGKITLDGSVVTDAKASDLRELRRHKIAMVFQSFGLLPHKTVLENISFGLKLRGVEKRTREERAREMTGLVGLNGNEEAFPSQLSGGMQQRVGLARALANDPQILLFDEPFSALDPLIRRDMQAEVVRLHKQIGKTMIFITHDLSEAIKLGNRIAIMRNGAIEQIGSPAEIVARPRNDYIRDFVQDVRFPDVVTLRWIMQQALEEPGEGPRFPADMLIRDAAKAALQSEHKTINVTEGGVLIGSVARTDIIDALITGSSPPQMPH